jgi:hypothetical protein
VRRTLRFLAGVLVGGGALAGYLAFVGVDSVAARLSAVAPGVLAAVAVLVVTEGVVDGLGFWASVRPLGDGLTGSRSVQFAVAGDFFDAVSPAGPVSSEPIMATFVETATGTTYSEALAVRSVAKYVKSGAQLLVSTLAALAVVLGGPAPRYVLTTLGGAVVGLALVGVVVVRLRDPISGGLAVVLGPVVRWVSGLYRETPHDRSVVDRALERFWSRIVRFRGRPGLLALVAVGGVAEQLLTATVLWVALVGVGAEVGVLAVVPLVAVVPLPQVASAVPIPGSLGAYDVLLGGAIGLVTAVSPATAAAGVLVVRTATLLFSVVVGGVAVAFLRGWRLR